MTLTNKLQMFGTAMVQLPGNVYHYWRPRMQPPYTVWQEGGGNSFLADNHTAEQALTGTLDYFTKIEYDPVLDKIQKILNELPLAWSLNSVQREEDTGLIHYEWIWTWV